MWLCERDLLKECEGEYKDCTDCVLAKIREEIQENINYNKKMNYQGIVTGLLLTLDIINTERRRQMPHSLRARLSGLRYKGILEDKDYKRLCKALDNEDVLDKIRDEIEQTVDEEQKHDEKWAIGLRYALKIIDKYREER